MRPLPLFVAAWLLIFIRSNAAQRVRTGRCPAAQKRADCSAYMWDACTCDQDCPVNTKCCFQGCNHVCVSPGSISVTNKADVVFIMDSSGSIGTNDYAKEKGFVKEMAKIFQISPTASRISTIIYDSRPELIFDFYKYTDEIGVARAIDSLPYLGNQTRIDKALALGVRVFTQSRPSVPRIAIILTDGKQTPDYDAIPLEVAAQPLHDLGVKVYVFGIGGHVDIDELNLIAKRPQDVFPVESFDKLLRVLQQFLTHVDKPEALPPVNLTSDLLFLMDASYSISRSDYGEQKDFLKDLIDSFTISPDYTRAGVITYSDTARLSIPLDGYSSNDALKSAVDGLPYLGGTKRLDRALVLADQTFAKSRSRVPKIAIVFTYGRRLSDPGSSHIQSAVTSLRNNGVSVFVIAIGENLDFKELGKMVNKPLDIASDPSFDRLQPYVGSIARYIVANADISAPLDPRTDVIFLMDGSGGVGLDNFKRQQEFVKSLAKSFRISVSGPRAGVVVYGQRAYAMVRLNDYSNLESFISKIGRTRVVNGERNMDVGLTEAANLFSRQGRDGYKVLILFSGGKNSDQLEVRALEEAMKLLRDIRARVYVVGAGPSLSVSQLRRVVYRSNDMFLLPSFISLPGKVRLIAQHVSSGYDKNSFQADVVIVLDSSTDVSAADFRTQKQFAKSLASAFNVGSGTRVSLMTYSDVTRLVSRFDDSNSVGEFERLVDGARYFGGFRRLDKALENTSSVFTESRQDFPKVLVLLAAGPQAQSPGTKSLDVASKAIKELGVSRFVVAAGDQIIRRELRLVVDGDGDMFLLRNMDALVPQVGPIVRRIIASAGYPDLADIDADIIFLLDSSKSVGSGDFSRQKDFIRAMAQSFNVSPEKSQVAVISYGDKARTVVRFGDDNNPSALGNSINKIPAVGGEGRVDKALGEAAALLRSARPSVSKIIIVLSGSAHAPEVDDQSLAGAARTLRILGGRVFAVAVGPKAVVQELRYIVETPGHVFNVSTYESLPRQVQPISSKIAHESDIRRPNGFSADVVFVMDSSSSVDEDGYQKQKQFVKSVARTLNVSPGNSRAALITYGDRPSKVLGFDIYRSTSEFENAVDISPYVGNSRRIDRTLDEVANVLSGARSTVPVIIVFLVAGKQTHVSGAKSLSEAAKPLYGRKNNIYAVAIGQETDAQELGDIVIRSNDIFSLVSFDRLVVQSGIIGRSIREGTIAPRPLDVDADVIFIMDSSSGISQVDYGKQKEFVKRMARYLNVSPQKSRAAVLTFGSSSTVVVSFDGYGTLSDFNQAVAKAAFIGGARRTDRVLEAVASLLNYARPQVPRIILLITAGRQAQESGAKPLSEAVRPVHQNGGKVYALAVGTGHDSRELRFLVRGTQDIFPILSFDDLQKQEISIADGIVRRTTPDASKLYADILFIMDSSSSVFVSDYSKEKEFVKSVGRYLNVAPQKSQAAVMSYGSVSTPTLRFSSGQSKENFERAVDQAPYQGGQRRIDRVLQEAATLFEDARHFTPKVVLLLTAGKQSRDAGVASLEEASEAMRHLGVRIFVMAIGPDVDAEELTPTVKNPEDIFELSSFNMLVSQAIPTAVEISKRTENPEVPRNFQADIIFIVDSSSSVSREDYSKEKRFVQYLIRYLKMSPLNSRVAFITFGYVPSLIAKFDSYSEIADFDKAVSEALYIGGSSRLDKAFRQAAPLLQEARALIPTMVIVLTAGWQSGIPGTQDLLLASQPFRNYGAKVYVIPFGNNYKAGVMQSIADKPQHIFPMRSFDVLQLQAKALASAMAKMSAPLVPEDFRADVVFVADSSSNIQPLDYGQEKTFIKTLGELFNVAPGQSRAALVTYGSYAKDEIRFDGYQSTAAFNTLVEDAPSIGGKGRIDLAMDQVVRLLKNARSSVPKIVLLLTAGKQSPENAANLDISAKTLRDNGGRMFVVAIGREPDVNKLVAVVEQAGDVFSLSSFGALVPNVVPVASQVVKQFGSAVPNDFQADIIFLVDASQSVKLEDFKKERSFVKTVASSFDVSEGRSRAAVITYGYTTMQLIRFDGSSSLSTFKSTVDRAPLIGGRRRIDKALEVASRMLSKARTFVPTIVILLTSGQQAPDSSLKTLEATSKPLRDHGAAVYAIAIGGEPDVNELNEVVKDLRRIFFVPSFDSLQLNRYSLAGNIARQTGVEPKVHADVKAEIVFLVDSSSGAGRDGFEKQKQFVKSVAKSLNLGIGNSRAAFISYSTHSRLIIPLDAHSTREGFNAAVDRLVFIGRTRRMDRALEGAAAALKEAQDNVPKIVILLTTGQQSTEAGAKPLEEAVRPLRSMNATVYVVAIGTDVNNKELESVVKSPGEDVFSVQSLDKLPAHSPSISNAIAKNMEFPIKPLDFVGDVILLIDASRDVGRVNYEKEKDFVKLLGKILNVEPGKSRVAVYVYSTYTRPGVLWNVAQTVDSFEKGVDRLSYIGQSRRMDRALEGTQRLLRDARDSVPKVVILLTAGKQTWEPGATSLATATKPLEVLGANIFVVAIGSRVDMVELSPAVRNINDVMNVRSFDELQTQTRAVAEHIANNSVVPELVEYIGDIVFLVDSSSGVGPDIYTKEKEFVAELADTLNFGPNKSRVAVVLYNTNPTQAIRFDVFSTSERLRDGLEALTYFEGKRRIDRALEETARILSNENRPVYKDVVLITAGRQSQEGDTKSLDIAVEPLRALGARTFVVALGSNPDISELSPVVERLADIIPIRTFADVKSQALTVGNYIMNREPSIIMREFFADIVFLMDASSGVKQEGFDQEKEFVKSMAQSLDIAQGKARVGVIVYGEYPRIPVMLGNYRSVEEFLEILNSLRFSGGNRRMDRALQASQTLLSSARPNVPKFVILLTGGKQFGGQSIKEEGYLLKSAGVKTLVVAVGPLPDLDELGYVVESRTDISTASNFESLKLLVQKVLDAVAEKSTEMSKVSTTSAKSAASTTQPETIAETTELVTTSITTPVTMTETMKVTTQKTTPEATEQTTAETTVQTTADTTTPERTPATTPVRTPATTPERTPATTPVQTPATTQVTATQATTQTTTQVMTQVTTLVPSTATPTLPSKSEILFLVDSSSGVSNQVFQSQKNFVKELGTILSIDPDFRKAAVIAYGGVPVVSVPFEGYQTYEGFERAIDKMRGVAGPRRIDLAIDKASETLRKGDPSATKIVIVLTAGKQDQDARSLNEAAQSLRDLKVKTYVVAIGLEPSTRALRPLVDELKDIYRVPSSEELINDVKRIGKAVEQDLPGLPAQTSEDVVFIMDSSATVTLQNFEKEKQFVKSLAKSMGVSDGNSRAALLVYSSNPQLVFKLGEYGSFSEFESKVDNSQLLGLSRRIDKALNAAFNVLSGSSPAARKTVFLLTSGPQSKESGASSLTESTEPLKRIGAKVYVVSVGNLPDQSELMGVVEKPTDLFKVPSFTELPALAPDIAEQVKTGKIQGSFVADVLFLIDSSSDVGRENYDTLKDFVKSISRTLNVSPGKFRAGVISYSSLPSTVAALGEYNTISTFSEAVDNSSYLGGARRMDLVLQAAMEELGSGRPAVSKLVLLLTAGRQDDGGKPLGQFVQPLRDLGARAYVVAVGDDVDLEELTPLVESSEDVFSVSSFGSLQFQVQPISLQIIEPPEPSSDDSDVIFLVDASRYVSSEEFSNQKDFVKSSVRSLINKLPKSRRAVAIYGNKYQFATRLIDQGTISDFDGALDGAPFMGGARRMDRAIEAAASELSSSKDLSRAVVVLLTVGKQEQEIGAKSLDVAAKEIHDLGATLYIVSVGEQTDLSELLPAVDKTSHVIPVPDSRDLPGKAGKITQLIVTETKQPRSLQMFSDIVFVMDSSYDVDPQDYTKQKELVKMMAQNLDVSEKKSRAALITYGDRAPLITRFEDHTKLEEFKSAVDSALYVGGMRKIDLALESVIRVMREARRTVPKVLVLLAAGGQDSEEGQRSLEDASRILRDSGVHVHVVAVGAKVNIEQLKPLVEQQEDIVEVASFKVLPTQADNISLKVEQSSGYLTPEDLVADIVFLVDSSDNVTTDMYQREKNFVKQLVRSLNIAPKKSRAALITYSTNPRSAFNLGKHDTIVELDEAVESVLYIGGTRRIDKALDAAANILLGARSTVLKIVVLLTTGKQTKASGASKLEEAVRPLRALGALMYAVSIGKEPNIQELRDVFDDVVLVPSPKDLPRHTSEVTKQIYGGAFERLRFAADIVFVVDTSTAVHSKTFQQEKDFIKALARHLNIAPEKSRVAFILYNSDPSVIGSLDSYPELRNFEVAVNNAPFLGGARRIDKALVAAARVLSKGRESVPRLAIILTTGRQAEVPGVTPLDIAAQSLRDVNAKAFVIAVGKGTDVRELSLVVGDPTDVISVYSEDDLIPEVSDISRIIRRGASLVRHPVISKADVVFLLDSSNGVDNDTFIEEKEFIKSAARHLYMSRDRTRAAVIRYASDASVVISLDTYGSLLDFNGAIDKITYVAGERRIDKALERTEEVLDTSREGVPKVVIVLTTGKQADPPGFEVINIAAQSLRSRSGTIVYVLGVGSQPDIRELKAISGQNSNLFLTASSELRKQAPQVMIAAASSIETMVPNNFIADILFLMDSSQTISSENFQAQKDFVKSLVRSFDISPTRSRSGVVSFGQYLTMSIRFNDYSDVHSFVRGVEVVPRRGGRKSLDKALAYAARILAKARPNSQKIAVIITDGKLSSSSGDDPLEESARALHSLRVKTYLVGVGENVNFKKLTDISEKPDDLFYARAFARLLRLVPSVTAHIVSGSMNSTSLMQRRDGMFLVDSSALLSTAQFETQIDFIKAIAKHLNVSPASTRLGVITYNSSPLLSISFDSYDSLSEFYTLLDGLPRLKIGRRLDYALELAEVVFKRSKDDIPKFIVVLAEGRYDLEPGVKALADAVKPFQTMGVTVYVIGIGASVNLQELNVMVENPQNVLTVKTFSSLLRDVGRIADHIDSTIKIPCTVALDVGFLLDASSSVRAEDFAKEKDFVKLMTGEIISASPDSRAGVIVFSDYPNLSLKFKSFAEMTASRFDVLIDKLPYQKGRTRIDRALGMASRELFTDKRDNVVQVMILITDGRQSRDPGYLSLKEAIKPLRAQNITILAVGIGESVDERELRVLTGNMENVFLVQSFGELPSLGRRLVSRSCQA